MKRSKFDGFEKGNWMDKSFLLPATEPTREFRGVIKLRLVTIQKFPNVDPVENGHKVFEGIQSIA